MFALLCYSLPITILSFLQPNSELEHIQLEITFSDYFRVWEGEGHVWQDVLGPIFSSLVHCMATQTLVSVDSPWYTMMELSNQSRKKAGPLFLFFFFFCASTSLLSSTVPVFPCREKLGKRTIYPFLTTGSPTNRSYLRRSY